MKTLLLILKDRRRSQRGSVLSGVLIIVAFLGIISGALMTELTGTFMVSRALVNRVNNEATVNSAIELAINQLQNTSLSSPCPNLGPTSINGLTAVASYSKCVLVVDRGSLPLAPIAQAAPFTIDGTHVVLPAVGWDAYLVSDVNGNVYEFNSGGSSPSWVVHLGGVVTGPPMAMYDSSNSPLDISDLVPVTNPGLCNVSNSCVVMLDEETGSSPSTRCSMPANAPVVARPAAAASFTDTAYFGDTSGTLWAYTTMGGGGDCSRQDAYTIASHQAMVAGPVVFRGHNSDNIYVVTSDGGSSRLVHFIFSGGDLVLVSSIALPAPNAVGLAADTTGSQAPARLAITFAGGQVALIQISSNFGMSLIASSGVATGVQAAPYWCHCPGADLIGVGGQNGALYLLDTGLNLYASYPAGGAAIATSPVADAAGDWFFGADDSMFHEVVLPQGQQTMTLAAQWPLAGRVASSPIVDPCGAVICIYLGAGNGSAYLVPLDARDATMAACISTAPPACSGTNPRLWVQVEVGSRVSPQTVHVTGWSYYSP